MNRPVGIEGVESQSKVSQPHRKVHTILRYVHEVLPKPEAYPSTKIDISVCFPSVKGTANTNIIALVLVLLASTLLAVVLIQNNNTHSHNGVSK
jgi:hypothetical protein